MSFNIFNGVALLITQGLIWGRIDWHPYFKEGFMDKDGLQSIMHG